MTISTDTTLLHDPRRQASLLYWQGFAAQRLRDAGEPVDLALLQTTIDLTDGADVPDMVRARLHKMTGLTLRDAGQNAEALAQFQRAMQLDRNGGVRKAIEQLERALKPKAEAVPRKTTKPRTRKPAAKPAAKRGRPPKAAQTAG